MAFIKSPKMKSKLNVSPRDVSKGRIHNTKSGTGNIGIASPNMNKIQELVSAKAGNPAAVDSGPPTMMGGVNQKKKRGLQLNAGNLNLY